MVVQKIITGGWHSRCLATGEFVTLVPNKHVLTHIGPVEFADAQQQPLYLDLSNVGSFKFCGQAWLTDGDERLEWEGGWKPKGPTTPGVSPLIYDPAGNLLSNPAWGSQGARFYLDRVWTGDETYSPSNGHDLNEWTKLPCGLVLGQRGAMSDELQIWDGQVHRRVPQLENTETGIKAAASLPRCRFIHAHEAEVNGEVTIGISAYTLNAAESSHERAVLTWMTEAEARALPEAVLPPPPPPEFFRPISEPLSKGTVIPDLSRYFIGKPETFPRTGKHTITQYLKNEGDVERVFFCKFYDPVPVTAKTPFTSKAHYEELRKGQKFFHQITDASNAPIMGSLTNTNWFPLEMKIGMEYGWDSGEHEIVESKSTDCKEFNRWGFTRFMAIMDAWEHFESGPDFPDIAVIKGIYDPTGGWHDPKRHLEIGYHGRDIGPLLWESYPTGPDPVTGHPGCYNAAGELILNDTTIGRNEDGTPMRSVMYRKDPRVVDWVPDIAPCVMSISPEPEYPPMPPPPPPVTPPPVSSSWFMNPGDTLNVDKPLVSQDKRFTLLYQSDGNLVLYGPNGPLWSTGTIGQSVGFCAFQGDGNFALYNKAIMPVWATGTNGKPAAILIVQNDGNVVIYGATGPLWASNTVYVPPAPPPIPPIPPGGATPDMHAWPKFGGSYNAGMTNPACDPVLFASLNRDAGGDFTRVNTIDAWAVGPNGTGQYAGFMPWMRDSDGVFDLTAFDPRWDERLNYYVRAQNAAGITVQLTVFDLYSWSERKQGLLWVPDQNLGPFRRNKNGVRWGDPDDPTFLALPDWVMLQHIARICAAVKGLAVCFETGNEMPEKDMHIRIAQALRSHFTSDWQPNITTNRQEDTSGQYFNMKIGTNFDRIAFHGKASLAYLDEVFEDEPSNRPNTFRKLWDQPWPEGVVDPKRIIMSSDGCRSNNTMDCYDWPVLAEVAKDHIRRGFTFEHQSRVKMQPFLEGTLDLKKYFEVDWLRSLR